MAAPASPTAPSQPSGNRKRQRATGRLKIGRLTGQVSSQESFGGEPPAAPAMRTVRPTPSARGPRPSAGRPKGPAGILSAGEEESYAPQASAQAEETPGNEPSSPEFGPDQLRDAEESAVGQPAPPTSSATAPGKLNYSSSRPRPSRASPLSSSTAGGKINYGGDVPDDEKSLYNSSSTAPGRVRFRNLFSTRRRQAALGGGAIGAIIAAVFGFSIMSGPFQFIHIAQLLTQFHFSSQQNEQDNRFMKEIRYWRYSRAGAVEKTRLSYLGNKVADSFETKMNAGGLSSAYTDKFGLFDGYVIDRSNSAFKDMSDSEFKQYIKDTYGVEAVHGSSIKGGSAAIRGEPWVIDVSSLSYTDTLKMNYQVLRQADYGRLSAAIGSRFFCVRAGCSWHPLTKLTTNGKRAVEEWLQKDKLAKENGQKAITVRDSGAAVDPNSPDAPAQTSADGAIADVNSQAQGAKGDSNKMASLQDSLHTKLLGGGAAAIGVLCMIKGVNDNADSIKQAQVVLPLIRMGVEALSVGSQVQSGKDADLSELGQLSKQLNGVSSDGKTTSWRDAKSIQANLGNPNTGVEPSPTLKTINKGAPFGFVNDFPGLGAACSKAGQIVTGIVSIAIDATGIGAAIGSGVMQIIQSVASGPVLNDVAHWLAGAAVDVGSIGADYGNAIDYGATLAANNQAIAGGGRALQPAEQSQLTLINNQFNQQQFQQHSLAYRLFNPYDQGSAISRVIDNGSPSASQNIAKMGAALFNVGRTFSNISRLFSGSARAATATSYDYGFPIYGFSVAELSDQKYANPYENTCYLFGCTASETATGQNIAGFMTDASGNLTATGQHYQDLAGQCFGVQITAEGGDGKSGWGVVAGGGDLPIMNKLPADCASTSDPNWERLRFFILDSETMNSMACYASDGSDPSVDQACTDIGFGSSSASSTDTSGSSASGSTSGTGSFQMIKLNPPLATPGGQITPKGITLHWWGSGSNGQGISALVDALRTNSSCGAGGCSVQVGITADGKVYQMTNNLTDLTYQAIGANNTTIGIEIEGGPADFGTAGITKYPQKFDAVVATVKYLAVKYNIPLGDEPVVCNDVVGVHPHKAYNSCPGALPKEDIDDAYFNAVMAKVRQ